MAKQNPRLKSETIFREIDGFESEICVYHAEQPLSILALHGFGGSATTYRKLIPMLTGTPGCWSVSLPWHGKTQSPEKDKPLNLNSYADALALLIRSETSQPVTLMVHSFGSRIALTLAVRHPDLVKHLILISPGGFFYREDFIFMLMSKRPFSMLPKSDFFLAPYTRFLIPGLSPAKLQKRMHALRMMIRSYPDISLRHNGVLKKLKNFDGTAVIIMGERDRLLPFRLVKRITGKFSKPRLHSIKKAGHLPMAEYPAKTASVISEYLTGK